jgi:hypothetical protein
MFGYVTIPQELIDQAKQQVRELHQQRFGNLPVSLVWAIAYEALAEEIRKDLSKQQINVSGLDFELSFDAQGN